MSNYLHSSNFSSKLLKNFHIFSKTMLECFYKVAQMFSKFTKCSKMLNNTQNVLKCCKTNIVKMLYQLKNAFILFKYAFCHDNKSANFVGK